ncbi:CU044_2847 family protein [Streptomyces sp. NPDC001709]
MSLGDGASILVEAGATDRGPVMAGRVADRMRDLPQTLHDVLDPVADAARTVLEQLRRARPDNVTVEFGVDLAAEAGAVIARSETSCHLKVTMTWAAASGDAAG